MPFDAVENYLVTVLRTMENDQNDLLWPDQPAGDNMELVPIVTKSNFDPLGLGVERLCVVVYNKTTEAVPLSIGGAHDRWYSVDWRPEIWCMFRPDSILRDYEVMVDPHDPDSNIYYDVVGNTQREEAFNLSASEVISTMIGQLLEYQNFPGYDDEYVGKYSARYLSLGGFENRDEWPQKYHQIVWTQPILDQGIEPKEFIGQSGTFSGFVIPYLVREAFLRERKLFRPMYRDVFLPQFVTVSATTGGIRVEWHNPVFWKNDEGGQSKTKGTYTVKIFDALSGDKIPIVASTGLSTELYVFHDPDALYQGRQIYAEVTAVSSDTQSSEPARSRTIQIPLLQYTWGTNGIPWIVSDKDDYWASGVENQMSIQDEISFVPR